MNDRICAHCGKDCEELEVAFRLPDAVFAVPRDEREKRVRQSSDLVSIDDRAFFIRCVAPFPVKGRSDPYNWGLWVKLARQDFDEYVRSFDDDPPLDHPGFTGTIANENTWTAPTLGLPVHVQLRSRKQRPNLMILEDAHPLAQQQAEGVSEAEVHGWSDACAPSDPLHPRPEPFRPRFTPTLEEEGWLVAEPHQVGRELQTIDGGVRPGDLVKAPFVFLASDEHGEVTQRVEYMWVRLDGVEADGWWTGTLNNAPFVPGPIGLGSRLWLRAEHVLAFQR